MDNKTTEAVTREELGVALADIKLSVAEDLLKLHAQDIETVKEMKGLLDQYTRQLEQLLADFLVSIKINFTNEPPTNIN